jgi:hypothetical protein
MGDANGTRPIPPIKYSITNKKVENNTFSCTITASVDFAQFIKYNGTNDKEYYEKNTGYYPGWVGFAFDILAKERGNEFAEFTVLQDGSLYAAAA